MAGMADFNDAVYGNGRKKTFNSDYYQAKFKGSSGEGKGKKRKGDH